MAFFFMWDRWDGTPAPSIDRPPLVLTPVGSPFILPDYHYLLHVCLVWCVHGLYGALVGELQKHQRVYIN